MTDFERMKATFEDVGVKYKIVLAIDEYGESPHEISSSLNTQPLWFDTIIEIDNGEGYGGFYAYFYFLEQKYVGHGVWE